MTYQLVQDFWTIKSSFALKSTCPWFPATWTHQQLCFGKRDKVFHTLVSNSNLFYHDKRLQTSKGFLTWSIKLANLKHVFHVGRWSWRSWCCMRSLKEGWSPFLRVEWVIFVGNTKPENVEKTPVVTIWEAILWWAWNPQNSTLRFIPFSKWSVTMVSK